MNKETSTLDFTDEQQTAVNHIAYEAFVAGSKFILGELLYCGETLSKYDPIEGAGDRAFERYWKSQHDV